MDTERLVKFLRENKLSGDFLKYTAERAMSADKWDDEWVESMLKEFNHDAWRAVCG